MLVWDLRKSGTFSAPRSPEGPGLKPATAIGDSDEKLPFSPFRNPEPENWSTDDGKTELFVQRRLMCTYGNLRFLCVRQTVHVHNWIVGCVSSAFFIAKTIRGTGVPFTARDIATSSTQICLVPPMHRCSLAALVPHAPLFTGCLTKDLRGCKVARDGLVRKYVARFTKPLWHLRVRNIPKAICPSNNSLGEHYTHTQLSLIWPDPGYVQRKPILERPISKIYFNDISNLPPAALAWVWQCMWYSHWMH
jgi:hypothetical protein